MYPAIRDIAKFNSQEIVLVRGTQTLIATNKSWFIVYVSLLISVSWNILLCKIQMYTKYTLNE